MLEFWRRACGVLAIAAYADRRYTRYGATPVRTSLFAAMPAVFHTGLRGARCFFFFFFFFLSLTPDPCCYVVDAIIFDHTDARPRARCRPRLLAMLYVHDRCCFEPGCLVLPQDEQFTRYRFSNIIRMIRTMSQRRLLTHAADAPMPRADAAGIYVDTLITHR